MAIRHLITRGFSNGVFTASRIVTRGYGYFPLPEGQLLIKEWLRFNLLITTKNDIGVNITTQIDFDLNLL